MTSRTIILGLVLAVGSLWASPAAGDRSEADLLAALGSSDYQVRRKAVAAAKGRTEAALRSRILDMARSDKHPNIRGYCADTLATFDGDARRFDVLLAMVTSDPETPRRRAFVALGQLGDPRAYDILVRGLSSGRIDRAYAAQGLGMLGDPRAFEPVQAMYVEAMFTKDMDDPYVRELVPGALVRLDRDRGLAFLRSRILAASPAERHYLGRVLGQEPAAETRVLMLDLLANSEDAALRQLAIRVLGKLADPQSRPGLLAAFDKHDAHRVLLADALGRLGAKDATPGIAKALAATKRGRDRNVYVAALGQIGDTRAVATLMPLLQDETFASPDRRRSSIAPFPMNTHVRGVALWAIRRILDGREPFPLTELHRFPEGPLGPRYDKQIADVQAWWKAHQEDARYRLTGE